METSHVQEACHTPHHGVLIYAFTAQGTSLEFSVGSSRQEKTEDEVDRRSQKKRENLKIQAPR